MKDQEPKEKTSIQEWLVEFLQSKRGVALFKILGFAFFFLIVLLFLSRAPKKNQGNQLDYYSSSSSTSSVIIKKDLTFADYKEKLLTTNYKIIMMINSSDKERLIVADMNSGQISGMVDNFIDGKKFILKEGIVYNFDETINDTILSNVNLDYLEVSRIFNLLNNYEAIISNVVNEKTTYTYQLPDRKIIISYTNDSYKIEIQEENDFYNIAYSF